MGRLSAWHTPLVSKQLQLNSQSLKLIPPTQPDKQKFGVKCLAFILYWPNLCWLFCSIPSPSVASCSSWKPNSQHSVTLPCTSSLFCSIGWLLLFCCCPMRVTVSLFGVHCKAMPRLWLLPQARLFIFLRTSLQWPVAFLHCHACSHFPGYDSRFGVLFDSRSDLYYSLWCGIWYHGQSRAAICLLLHFAHLRCH